ncbi:glycosyltransferase [Planococcus sp. APC 3900]|uniref:glycosyltransferase n=1 Tax=Planococcus sp. APC 3900 TaxID=3035191 RepID=UPI0025B4A464|nr:glycosyltransferase [Planococcus sp. APC 3900]MDN3439758.1 glycosyltransferase [Planococcus sp. APC 3900]
MIRILHVLGALDRGGAETMIMNLYRNIDRNLIQFDFVVHTLEKGDYEEEINSLGGIVYRIAKYTGKNHILYKKLWKDFFVQHPEYKIIHGHMRSTASIYLKIAKKLSRITISHSHSTSSGTGFSSFVKDVLQFPIRYTADYFLACSQTAGEWLYGKEITKRNNFFIVKNGIDTDNFLFDNDKRLRKRKELEITNKLVIGHIGRFVHAKNHSFLIEIFNELHYMEKESVLLLVGDGEDKQYIKKKVKNMNLQNKVLFIDPQSDISDYLFAMDTFVFPSIYEGLGIAVIEAQASNLPCVISDNIPLEACLSNDILRLSLELSAKEWARYILKSNTEISNKVSSNRLVKEKYDIKESTLFMSDFYCNIIK